jgi:hypothetical protein
MLIIIIIIKVYFPSKFSFDLMSENVVIYVKKTKI